MQPCNPNAKLETKCLHAGYTPKNGGPGTVPIVQSTTYRFDSTEKVAELFDMPMEPMYSRFANPTCDAVEQKIAALEGGVGAMLTSSGQAASLLSVLNLCSAGDSIVSVSTIYGGTVNLFGVTLKRFGIECIWVDPLADEETISQAIQPNTKLIFGETIANPALTVFDIEKFAKIAHAHQIPLIVDNTFATPILCRPIEFGADIVIHSTTKYMDGHALQCGGVIVDGGTFDWEKSGKFPDFTEPDESYHGVVYTREFGKMAYIIKARMQLMRDFGCIPAEPGTGDSAGTDEAVLRKRHDCGKNAERVRQDRIGDLSRSAGRPVPQAGRKVFAGRHLRRYLHLHQRRQRGSRPVYGCAPAGVHRGTRGRHPHLRAAPGIGDSPPAHRGTAESCRHRRRSDPHFRRSGKHRRYHRRPETGAGTGLIFATLKIFAA